jgi:hypothetical protein
MYRLIVGMTAALFLLSGKAFAFDLSGAWASDRALCDRVFKGKGSAVSFTEMSDLYGSGFIVNGDAIQGKSAKCSIRSRKENGNVTTLSASCASSIMTDNYQFSYRVVDDNTIERLFPDVENMAMKFSRCSL